MFLPESFPKKISRMKVLLIHNSYQQPGGEDVVFEQECRLLQRHGHEVITYHRSNHELDDLSLLERVGLIGRIISADDTQREVRRLLHEQKPDLVHIHNTFMMISPSVYEVCNDANIPVLQTLHNYRLLCPKSTFYRDGKVCEDCMEKSIWQGVKHGCYRNSRSMTAAVALMLQTHRTRQTWETRVGTYLALTEFARQKFIDGGLPAEKIRVKPNFVDPDPGERTKPGKYALFVGRLSQEKGLITLLAAWKRLGIDVPLLIVGDGPLRGHLESEVESQNLENVHFTGWLPRQEVQDAMKNAAFLVVPSVWYETFGMIMTEGFACGTPSVGSRLGAIEEIIDDGKTGLHFTPGDADDLAEKVTWAWEHSSDVEAMGKAGRRTYEDRYTADNNYTLLMGIYREAMETHVRYSPN